MSALRFTHKKKGHQVQLVENPESDNERYIVQYKGVMTEEWSTIGIFSNRVKTKHMKFFAEVCESFDHIDIK